MSGNVYGVVGGYALNVPQYAAIKRDFVFGGNPNILDDHLPHEFTRVVGTQDVKVTRLTAGVPQYSFRFTISGGVNANSGGYVGMTDNSATYSILGPVEGGTYAYVNSPARNFNPVVFDFTTTDGGRVYRFAYSPYAFKQPTLTLTQFSLPLGNDTLLIEAVTRRYADV